jgi:hypothetical protein
MHLDDAAQIRSPTLATAWRTSALTKRDEVDAMDTFHFAARR